MNFKKVRNTLVEYAPATIKSALIRCHRPDEELHTKLSDSKKIDVLTDLAIFTPYTSVQEILFDKSTKRKKEDRDSIILCLSNNSNLRHPTKKKINSLIDTENEQNILRLILLELIYSSKLLSSNHPFIRRNRLFNFSTLVALNRNISPQTHQNLLEFSNDMMLTFFLEIIPIQRSIFSSSAKLTETIYPPLAKNMYRLLKAFRLNNSLNQYTIELLEKSEDNLSTLLRKEVRRKN